jgi:hypothetical protein
MQLTELRSGLALAALIGLILAASWRDGVPNDGYDGSQPRVYVHAIAAEPPNFGRTLGVMRNVLGLASTSAAEIGAKALVPTAPPVQLLIPTLNVHRPVEAVGVNRSRVLNVPVNAWNAGWYKYGPVPGAPGDAVIEGHAGFPGEPMLFGRLGTLRPSDQVIVVLADGSRQLFLVQSMTSVPAGSALPGLAEPNGPARLTLLTCSGQFDQASYSYSKRLVVEASYAGPA